MIFWTQLELLVAIGFIFLGPLPFLDIEPEVILIQGVSAAVGVGYAMIATSSFMRANSAAMKLGYEDNIKTYIKMPKIQ